ncbi:MAG: hypothetical protein ACI4PE_03530 [Bacilli bacterium]
MNKKKKVIIICIICLGLILIPYISYRVYSGYLHIDSEYLSQGEKIIENLNNEEYITINKREYQGDYLEYKNIKIANEFNEFLLSDKLINLDSYILKDTAFFTIGTKESEIERLKESELYYIDCEKTMKKIIKENNLKNDIDLFNYIKTYKFSKNSFFTSIEKIKTDHIISDYLLTMPQISKITYINGDYNGYI